MNINCGEATMQLLKDYGVTTVFGIPGVHTLDLSRAMSDDYHEGKIRHIQARNEQGAAFMAEGWARATGQAGVAVVISGPGVTNASTALGQCYADSLPLLLISAEAASYTIGKGWGVLHEISEQKRVTEPLCAFSESAKCASDIPELIGRAFSIFESRRPRPVHISIPIDVQAELTDHHWQPTAPEAKPVPHTDEIKAAAELLKAAHTPVLMIGGGAVNAAGDLTQLAENCGAVVVASTAGKGIVPDNHPLSLSASTVRPEVQEFLKTADVILAVGTELSETDSFVERLDLAGKLIRIDIDPHKINDFYPAHIGIVADAGLAIAALRAELAAHSKDNRRVEVIVSELRDEIAKNLTPAEQQHKKLLDILAQISPKKTIFSGDACQLVYTGAFAFPVSAPRRWFYPAGYCALGNALPNAIGAKLARPDMNVVALAGDGGFMFTMPELITAAQCKLSIPVIIWENSGLKQIQDDMDSRQIERVGVEGINPDFVALAKACRANGIEPASEVEFCDAFAKALTEERPTVIVIHEGADWLI